MSKFEMKSMADSMNIFKQMYDILNGGKAEILEKYKKLWEKLWQEMWGHIISNPTAPIKFGEAIVDGKKVARLEVGDKEFVIKEGFITIKDKNAQTFKQFSVTETGAITTDLDLKKGLTQNVYSDGKVLDGQVVELGERVQTYSISMEVMEYSNGKKRIKFNDSHMENEFGDESVAFKFGHGMIDLDQPVDERTKDLFPEDLDPEVTVLADLFIRYLKQGKERADSLLEVTSGDQSRIMSSNLFYGHMGSKEIGDQEFGKTYNEFLEYYQQQKRLFKTDVLDVSLEKLMEVLPGLDALIKDNTLGNNMAGLFDGHRVENRSGVEKE